MRLYLNRARNRLVAGLSSPSNVPEPLEVVRGDNRAFDCVVCEDFTKALELDPVDGPVITDFRCTAKEEDALGKDSFIVSNIVGGVSEWTKTGTGVNTVYTLAPSFNVVALNDLFIVGGVVKEVADAAARLLLTTEDVSEGDVVRQVDIQDYFLVIDEEHLANDTDHPTDPGWSTNEPRKPHVDLLFEVEYVADGQQTSFWKVRMRVGDDVSKGNEGAMTDATPGYPLPAVLDVLEGSLADLEPAESVEANLFEPDGFGSLYRRILPEAGAGAFTAAYGLPVVGVKDGAQVEVNIELPASVNPTVELRDASAEGTLLATVTNPGPGAEAFWYGRFRFNGTAWKKIFAAFQ